MFFRIPKPCRVCWLVVLAVLVLAVAAQPRTGRAAGSARLTGGATESAGSATYLDPSGDSGTAPDITSVVVSSDAERRISFRVNLVRPPVPSEGRIAVAIDSDQNAATGYGGFEYVFLVDLSTNDVVGARWDGAELASTQLSSATASSDSTGVSFAVNARQLATTRAFCFVVRTMAGYGDIRCSATAAGRPLQATAIPTYRPAAGCSWRLPTRSTGSTLHATVTVTLDGATTNQTFTATIR